MKDEPDPAASSSPHPLSRRQFLQRTGSGCSLLALGAMAGSPGPTLVRAGDTVIKLTLQTRDKNAQPIRTNETVDAGKVGIIIIDPWNYHWCMTAAQRVGALVPRMNGVLECARQLGMQVIWAPTDVAGMYVGTPQRERALAVAYRSVPKVLPDLTCNFSVPGNHCMCGPGHSCLGNYGWDGMHPDLVFGENDLISCGTQETYSNLVERGITHVIYMGVHTNVCVFGKPEAIRYMWGAGLRCMLARDITDAITQYVPADGFTPDYGTQRVIEDLEKAGLPTINMVDEMKKARRWNDDWIVDPVRVAPWGTEARPYVFDDAITVTLAAPSASRTEIRYTLDGTDPNAGSARYTRPLTIDRTTDLRTVSFRDGRQATLPSRAYFVRLPAKPPKPDVFLDTLEPLPRQYPILDCFWIPKINLSYESNPLRVRGQKYARGLGMLAPANNLYEIKPAYDRFVALAGVDDNRLDQHNGRNLVMHCSVVFKVFIDGRLAAESPVVRISQEPWRFDVKIPAGARRINLAVTDAGSRSTLDLANWVDAGFVLKGRA